MFGFLKRKKNRFFRDDELELITKAIRSAEKETSGEVRVFVEARCSWIDAIDRAKELFFSMKMDQTSDRNGTLVYVAMKDHQLAVFGDEGIHAKVGTEYWTQLVREMISCFSRDNYAEGIAGCVLRIGQALKTHFPYQPGSDRNELPDEVAFGK
ncbi:MAG TPA: TPM domain-containing protein [Chitinophagaceae bacterium]|nr:TPM domain-containing protein [Chitinophagaceae bacterium]